MATAPVRFRGGRQAAGFTLIELMIVLAIIVVLGAAAAPSFATLVANQRGRAAASDLYAALTLARSEAIKRNLPVSLLPASSDNWTAGWRISNPTDSGHPLLVHGALANGTIAGPATVVYLASGRVQAGALPSFDVSFPHASVRRCVQVDLGGRVTTTTANAATSCTPP